MIIRTSTFGQNQTKLNQLMAQQSKLLELQQQADSQKKVNTLSDNPLEISTIMNLNEQLAKIQSYYKSIDSASNQLSMLDGVFYNVNNRLDRIHDLGLQMLNGTGNQETVSAAKTEIDQLLQSVVDSANENYNGEYIFSGAKVDKAAYTVNKDADGNITSILYNGSANGAEGSEKRYEISNGVKVTVNATGDYVFGEYNPPHSTGLLGALGELSNVLGNYPTGAPGDVYPDMDAYNAALEHAMEGLEDGQKHVAAVRSDFGSRASRLSLTKASLEDLELSSTSHKSSIVDLDMVEALSNLVQQNYAYQASMQTYMMLQQNSLMNYL